MSTVENEMSSTNPVVANQDKAFFDANGYLGPFTVQDSDVTKALWNQLRIQLLNKKKAVYPDVKMNYDRHLDIKILSDVVSHPEIVSRVESILGPNLLCWRTEWFPKYPGDQGTAWHQAESFVAFEGDKKLVPTQPHDGSWEVTVWFGFTDATRETACLKVIPGTHRTWFFDERRNIEYDPTTSMKGTGSGFFGYDFEKLKIDPNWQPDESQALHFEMQAGQAFMFTSRCLHASEPNTSKDRTRMGLAIRYVPTDVRVYPFHEGHYTHFGEVFPLDNYATMLVAGEDTFGHNKVVPPLTGAE
jgi:non-haem Fe2+, alpha-ketoglutarate-dependent halogenase